MSRGIRTHLLQLALVVALAAVLTPMGQTSSASIPPLKEISYYPRNHAWLEFWEDWPDTLAEMDHDLGVIRALGANTVRIFVHPKAFSYYDERTPTEEQLARLEAVLNLIDAHNLKAHVTLFDCWWSWPEIEASKAWMAAIVGPYREDPRIAVWELQNEVDLSQQVVRDWVRALFPDLKQLAGSTPCTVSVRNVEWLDDVRDLTSPTTPDLYSLHWYPSSPLTWTTPLTALLERAQKQVDREKLLLGEFGYHTCCVSEATQADLYRDVLYAAHQQGIVHLGQWTLYDFPEGTTQCDPKTEASCAERHFGIYRVDGSPKPAAQVLADAFQGQFPPAPSPSIVRNASFEEDCPNPCGLANWYPWDEGWTGRCWFEQDCSEAHSGNCSVRVTAEPAIAVGPTATIGLTTTIVPTMTVGLYNVPAFPVESGRRYSLQGYAKSEGLGGEAWIAFSWFDANQNWLGQDTRSESISGTVTTWTRLHIDYAAPPRDAAYAQVFAQVSPSHLLPVVWFDDLTLVQKAYLPLVRR